MTEIMANDLSFKDQTYLGFLSVIQTIINYIFVISWILLSVVVAFSLVFLIALFFIS
jgi:ethanolamine utilization cobalamin adenosyltransferase